MTELNILENPVDSVDQVDPTQTTTCMNASQPTPIVNARLTPEDKHSHPVQTNLNLQHKINLLSKLKKF